MGGSLRVLHVAVLVPALPRALGCSPRPSPCRDLGTAEGEGTAAVLLPGTAPTPSPPPRAGGVPSALTTPVLASLLPRNELNDHLDTIDSNLDNLQTMLTTHGFSVDTSALLDVSTVRGGHGGHGGAPSRAPLPCPHRSFLWQLFSPSMTVTDMNLPDLDSSLASVSSSPPVWLCRQPLRTRGAQTIPGGLGQFQGALTAPGGLG